MFGFHFRVDLPETISREDFHNVIQEIPLGFHDLVGIHVTYVLHVLIKEP